MKKQLFNLDAEYTFRGTFVVRAQTPMEAREVVGARCGMTIGGGIHTTLGKKDVDWKFPMHPQRHVVSVKANPIHSATKQTARESSETNS